MDGMHVPPWDTTGTSFQEYPSAVAITAEQGAKRPSKSEKALRLEQEKLQTMINSTVRLSAPSGIAAGGEAAAIASPARRTAEKHKKKLQLGLGLVPHRPTQSDSSLISNPPGPQSMDETGGLADNLQQPKLGKRKAGKQGASRPSQERANPGSGAQPLPAREASQHEGARKRSKTEKSRGQGLAQEIGHSSKTTTQDEAILPSDAGAPGSAAAPQHGQKGAGRAKHSQQDAHQNLQSNLAQDSAPSAQAPEAVRIKRSRNKFKQETAAVQPELPRSGDSAPGAQAPDMVYTKRIRNKFKQASAASQQALPVSLVPEVTAYQSVPDDAALNANIASQQDGLAQQPIKPSRLIEQHDKQSDERSGEQMKGNATGQEGKAARRALDTRDAGKAKNDDATADCQMARVGARGRKEDGLLSKMRAKLAGSQFRWLNEQLYTCPGAQAFELMQDQPQLFTQYHEGFKQQTAKWPLQPIQAAAAYLTKHSRKAVVADFGCGDAELARMAPQERVHSLDLVSSAPGVIACNMADTPLDTASVDVAVFCLALMGTDYPSFLREAARVLRPHGTIWIAEVRSRFVPEDASQEDFRPFLQAMGGLGFKQKSVDCSNTHFVTFEFQRQQVSAAGDKLKWPQLRACTYKKR